MSLIPFTQSGTPAISSLEIAEVTGKEHRNIMIDIRRILSEAGIDGAGFLAAQTYGNNNSREIFLLPRRECDLVVSGYSVKYRLAIIDRWHELEANIAAPSLPEMLRLAASAMEENERLKITVADQAPKVEFHDTVTASNTVVEMGTAAGVAKLPFGRTILYRKLREMGVLINGGGRHNLPKQRYISQGLFTVDEFKFNRSNGDPDVSFTTHVTQKGIAWLIKQFGGAEGRAA